MCLQYFVRIFCTKEQKVLSLTAVSRADSNPEVKRLKVQQEVLKLNTELNKLRIDYEKTVSETSSLREKAMEANANANASVPTFSTSDAAATAKEAKERAKALKKVNAANKKLAKNQKQIESLQKKMQKVQNRLDALNKKIEFVTQ